MSGRSVKLTTLFLGRLTPPKRLTSTSCTYFRQLLTTAVLNQRKEKRKYVAKPGIEPRIFDLRVRCPADWATQPGCAMRSGQMQTRVSMVIYLKLKDGWMDDFRFSSFSTVFHSYQDDGS